MKSALRPLLSLRIWRAARFDWSGAGLGFSCRKASIDFNCQRHIENLGYVTTERMVERYSVQGDKSNSIAAATSISTYIMAGLETPCLTSADDTVSLMFHLCSNRHAQLSGRAVRLMQSFLHCQVVSLLHIASWTLTPPLDV